MNGSLFKLAIEVAKKTPFWKKALVSLFLAAAPVVAKNGAQKAIDKLFKDRKKSLKKKLDEIKKLSDGGDITEEEYQKIRQALLEHAAKEV